MKKQTLYIIGGIAVLVIGGFFVYKKFKKGDATATANAGDAVIPDYIKPEPQSADTSLYGDPSLKDVAKTPGAMKDKSALDAMMA